MNSITCADGESITKENLVGVTDRSVRVDTSTRTTCVRAIYKKAALKNER